MITFEKGSGLFSIRTRHSSYVFDSLGRSVHWGGPVAPADCVPAPRFFGPIDPDVTLEAQEYPVADGQYFPLPCLEMTREGVRPGPFRLEAHRILPPEDGREALELTLTSDALTLVLTYEVFPELDLIRRGTRLQNNGSTPLELRRFLTAALHPPAGEGYSLRYLSGNWTAENQITDTPVTTGTFTLESRTGDHRFNPSFALSREAREETGEVWFGLLACTGSWKIEIEKTFFGTVSILAGPADEPFSLSPGETLTAPPLLLGYTAGGFGAMSRTLHRFQRRYYPHPDRPVLYNSWEATGFDVSEENQIALARLAADLGAERFVLDDGWFGDRNDDRAGLGDWTVNPQKFPRGLGPLIEEVRDLGMDFGLWVEPECVNPDSLLYRTHPDWILRQPGYEPRQIRNQYRLDLSLPQVEDHILSSLRRLLTEYPISFLKWDMNRPLTEIRGRQAAHQSQALHHIWDTLKQEFPRVELENCASGGGRTDLAMLSRCSQCWTSDNTDPFERLFIQEGFTQFYPPSQMMCWVTDMDRGGRAGLTYRFHSAMCGGLGIGCNITRLSDEDRALCRCLIAQYQRLRPVILRGDLYRLLSPREGPVSAVQYVWEEESVVLAFLHSQVGKGLWYTPDRRLRLRGLDPDARYETDSGETFTGSTLLNLGLPVTLRGDFDSVLIHLKKI